MKSTPTTRTKNRCSPRVARILRECLSGEGQVTGREAGAIGRLGASRRCSNVTVKSQQPGLP